MEYVELFLFAADDSGIVLQRSPRGIWTGVFGAIKDGESISDAANRVYIENTGMPHHRWKYAGKKDNVHLLTGESTCTDCVVVQHRCVADFIGADDTVRLLSLNACEIIANHKGVILNLAGEAHAVIEDVHPQLEPAQVPQPDFSNGMKIGIACNEYTHFNKLVQKLRDLPQNINNRFYCVLSTTNIYGLVFDFYFKYEAYGPLCPAADNAVYVMKVRGMSENDALFNEYIKPAL